MASPRTPKFNVVMKCFRFPGRDKKTTVSANTWLVATQATNIELGGRGGQASTTKVENGRYFIPTRNEIRLFPCMSGL